MDKQTTAALQERVSASEQAVKELRSALNKMEREVVVMRADLERLRVETQQAVGAKLP